MGEYYGLAVAANAQLRMSPTNLDQNLINRSARISVRPNESTETEICRFSLWITLFSK
jgi:hypothetical protein